MSLPNAFFLMQVCVLYMYQRAGKIPGEGSTVLEQKIRRRQLELPFPAQILLYFLSLNAFGFGICRHSAGENPTGSGLPYPFSTLSLQGIHGFSFVAASGPLESRGGAEAAF